ncbi:MAG: tetratricopeptide repeat protein [Oscillospiraceae bacterium]|nr:tetratricopeptide repeat protein [Oscillospiraceae bacterium]
MSKKIIIAVMILILITVGLIIGVSGRNSVTTTDRIAQASKYFEMMDYDKTIAIYNEIISADSTCAEAYIGLAEAYAAKGNMPKAAEILERGIEATGQDKTITDKIHELSITIMSNTEDGMEAVTELDETTAVTTVLVTEETTIPESTTVVTTEETTTVPETTTVTTTEETTTVPETTTVTTTTTTTAATTRATTVATEKATITVPKFIGITKEEAFKLAEKNNINLIFEYEENDTYANGVVFYQSSREGTLVAPSTLVYAYVCVNDTEYVSESDKVLNNFYSSIEKWSKNNTDKVSSVYLDKESDTVVVNAVSTKRFILDQNVVSAFRKCDDATLKIVCSDFTMSIKSSSVTSDNKLDLSSSYNGNYARASFTIDDGADNCQVTVVLKACEINGSDYEDMKLYPSEGKPKAVKLSIDEEPIISISSSGTYTIK